MAKNLQSRIYERCEYASFIEAGYLSCRGFLPVGRYFYAAKGGYIYFYYGNRADENIKSIGMNKYIFLILFCFFLAGIVAAQDTAVQQLPARWTLQDCISYAEKNNITLNTLRLSTSSAQQDLLQARANRLPNLNGSVSQSIVNSNNTDPVVGGFQTQANFSSSYGVSSSVVLYNGGYLNNDIKAKELSLQSARLNVAETANDITLNITQAFLNILLSKENISYLQEVLTTSQAQLEQGQQRYAAGSISKKDLLQFESQLATDQYNLVNANNSYRLNIVALKQILQLPTSLSFEVETPENVEPRQAVIALPNAQEAAQQVRPEIMNKELAVQLSEVELEKIKAGRLPVISLGAGLSSGYSDNATPAYFSQLNNNFYQSAAVTMSIPIFNRRQNKTNIAKSKIVIQQSQLDLQNTRITLNQEVERAYINLQNAQAQYVAGEAQLKAAAESYQITNQQLKLGAVTALEVLQQKNSYVQALQTYVQAKYTAVLYNKIYDFYTGIPVSF